MNVKSTFEPYGVKPTSARGAMGRAVPAIPKVASKSRRGKPNGSVGAMSSPVVVIVGLAWTWIGALGCGSEVCLLNSDCAGGAVCLDGTCRAACSSDEDCAQDSVCVRGGCGPGQRDPGADASDADTGASTDEGVEPGVDAARTDAGPDDAAPALDAGTDGGRADGAVADAGEGADGSEDATAGDGGAPADVGTGDSEVLDGAAPDADEGPRDGGGSDDDGAIDGGEAADGDLPPGVVDVSGIYTVAREVVLSNNRELPVGALRRTLVTLSREAGRRYRMEVLDPDGVLLFRVESLNLTAPELGRYQFTYVVSSAGPAPDCAREEARFERGEVVVDGERVALRGTEDLEVRLVGEGCPAGAPTLTRSTARWTPIAR